MTSHAVAEPLGDDALVSIYTITAGDTYATNDPVFLVFTYEELRAKWRERHADRLATGARYWRRRRTPGWLR